MESLHAEALDSMDHLFSNDGSTWDEVLSLPEGANAGWSWGGDLSGVSGVEEYFITYFNQMRRATGQRIQAKMGTWVKSGVRCTLPDGGDTRIAAQTLQMQQLQ